MVDPPRKTYFPAAFYKAFLQNICSKSLQVQIADGPAPRTMGPLRRRAVSGPGRCPGSSLATKSTPVMEQATGTMDVLKHLIRNTSSNPNSCGAKRHFEVREDATDIARVSEGAGERKSNVLSSKGDTVRDGAAQNSKPPVGLEPTTCGLQNRRPNPQSMLQAAFIILPMTTPAVAPTVMRDINSTHKYATPCLKIQH